METMALKNGRRLRICVLAVLLSALIPLGDASAQGDWAATLYTGRLTDETLGNIARTDFNMEDAY
jgi:hypothetical protein